MRKNFTDVDLNRSVGNLLRIGVLLSVATALIGFIKLFSEGFTMPRHYEDLGNAPGNVLQNFKTALMKGEGMGIIQLGILFLILTPLVRILFALAGYLKEKDYTYVVISMIVLCIMVVSFMFGFAK